MKNILLKGVFDQGVRDWLCIRYDHYIKSNTESKAYWLAVSEADKTFGKWHTNNDKSDPKQLWS